MREGKLFDLTVAPVPLRTASSVEGVVPGKNELSSKVAGVEHRGQFTSVLYHEYTYLLQSEYGYLHWESPIFDKAYKKY
ncbi:hypothetical protein KAI78_01050 [bacterium]|nr:hypothetical protein [bacterium]